MVLGSFLASRAGTDLGAPPPPRRTGATGGGGGDRSVVVGTVEYGYLHDCIFASDGLKL